MSGPRANEGLKKPRKKRGRTGDLVKLVPVPPCCQCRGHAGYRVSIVIFKPKCPTQAP